MPETAIFQVYKATSQSPDRPSEPAPVTRAGQTRMQARPGMKISRPGRVFVVMAEVG